MSDITNQMIASIADSLVKAISERLLQDTAFIEAISSKVDTISITASVADALSENETFIESLSETIRNNLDAEHIDGLEDAIEERVEKYMRNYEIESDDVVGLDRAIEDGIETYMSRDFEIEAVKAAISNSKEVREAIMELVANDLVISQKSKASVPASEATLVMVR